MGQTRAFWGDRTNKVCSQETVAAVLDDLRARRLDEPRFSSAQLDAIIRERQPRAMGLAGWSAIDRRERADGEATIPPRPRRKLGDFESMLAVADAGREGAR